MKNLKKLLSLLLVAALVLALGTVAFAQEETGAADTAEVLTLAEETDAAETPAEETVETEDTAATPAADIVEVQEETEALPDEADSGDTIGEPEAETEELDAAALEEAAGTVDELAMILDGDDGDDEDSHDGWTAIGSSDFTNSVYTISADGSYYLSEDITGSITINDSVTVTLCLNGKTITCGDASKSVIELGEGASLTLEDCSTDGTGTITRSEAKTGNGAGIYVGSSATFTMNGGTISKCTTVASKNAIYGGGVYVGSSASFTMNGGTISECDAAGYGGGVYVGSSASFTMSGGTISECKASLNSNGNLGVGGGVCVWSTASFTFEDGSITSCRAYQGGGGVYVYYSGVFSMAGGSISSCKSYYETNGDVYGDGGGVYLLGNGAAFTMSGGIISSNEAGYNGGGIALESSTSGSTFTMTGGKICDNTAGNCGGGISIFMKASVATISKGEICNNTAKRELLWAGGGIYVNSDCTLYLTNVAIYGNTAGFIGGGIAACQTADTKIYINDGGIIYGNTNTYDTDSYGDHYSSLGITLSDEINVRRDTTGVLDISSIFLGGGIYSWTQSDGTAISDLSTWLEQQKTSGTSNYASINNTQSDAEEAVLCAMSLAQVLIYGNTASNGGGIGVNGSVIIGTDNNTTSVTVTKSWEEADTEHPDSVTVWLTNTVNGVVYKIRSAELNADNSWTYTFTDLPTGFTYGVEEVSIDGYISTITGDAEEGFTITNTATVDISGSKTWDDADDQDGVRPDSITIRLLANGTEIDSATVTAEDDWSWSFTGLPKYASGTEIAYTVTEDTVTDYTTTYDGYNVTNSYTPSQTSVTVTKAWDDGDDADGLRPESVTVTLLADGEDTGLTLTLSEDNNWTGSFTGLDEYASGVKIVYTIQEASIDGYTAAITGDAETGFVVKNSHTPTATPAPTVTPTVTPETTPTTTPETTPTTTPTATPETTATAAPSPVPATAEATPTATPNKAPATGDGTNIALWAVLALGCAAGLIVLARKGKRKA